MATVSVFQGTGSMTLDKVHDDIPLRLQGELVSVDITNAVVLEVRSSFLNNKLGAFNTTSDTWGNDSITMPVGELVTELEAQSGAASISSVGSLSDKLESFKTSVLALFASGSETLFDEETFAALDHSFTAAKLLALMKASTIAAGAAGNNLALANINKLLRDAVDKKINRADAEGAIVAEVDNGFVKDDRVHFVDGVLLKIAVSFVDSSPASRDLDPANLASNSAGMQVQHDADLVLHVV